MNLFRLARLFETKYGLKSEAASSKETFDDVKRELKDAYDNYINPKTFKKAYNILIILDSLGEIHARQITSLMQDLNTKIFDSTPQDMLTKVNSILAIIDSLQEPGHIKIRNSIRKHWNETQRRVPTDNELKMALSKWEQVVNKKLAYVLLNQAKKLKVLAKSNELLQGGPVKPMVREPTVDEQNKFRLTPLAVAHHLDNDVVFNKIWTDEELQPEVIKLINKSENNSDIEINQKVMDAALAILAARRHQRTNEGLFNAPEEVAQQRMNVLPSEEEWSRNMQEAKRLKQEDPDQGEDPIMRDEMHRRKLEERDRQIKEDRERHVRKEGNSRLEQIFKRYQ